MDELSGPLADMGVYQDGKKIATMGVASGNTLAVLGIEELHRRQCKSLNEYLLKRPEIPKELWN